MGDTEFLGSFRNGKRCLDYVNGEKLQIYYCHNMGASQLFSYTYRNQIVVYGKFCFCKPPREKYINFCRCDETRKDQKWIIDKEVLLTVLFPANDFYF